MKLSHAACVLLPEAAAVVLHCWLHQPADQFCLVTAWKQDFPQRKRAPGPNGWNCKLPKLSLAGQRRPLGDSPIRRVVHPVCFLLWTPGDDFFVHSSNRSPCGQSGSDQAAQENLLKRIKPWVSWSELTAEPAVSRSLNQDLLSSPPARVTWDTWVDLPTS